MRLLTSLPCLFALAAVQGAFGQTTTTSGDEPEDTILGFRGRSKYQIVVPDVAANAAAETSVTRAAELLQQAFAANKITLPVVKESQAEAARPAFYLGATKYAAANGADSAKLSGWAYRHKVVGRNVIIVGRDEPDSLAGKRISSKEKELPYEGTLFGVAEFVHHYAGARFLSPDEAGTTFVPQSIIHVPFNLDAQGAPQFSEHDMHSGPELFYTANHCGRFTRIWSRFGHQHPSAVPIGEYGKSHPEYFILTGNVRQPELGATDGQLCLSNPEVRELIYQHILARCDEGFDVVELGQADGFRPCQCEECAALFGVRPTTKPSDGIAFNNDRAWAEKIWIIHRDMALRLMKDRPGKKIMMTSYGPTLPPPQTFREFPENTIIEMMHSDEEAFAAWKQLKVPGGFSAYLYNWGNFHLVGLTPLTTVSMSAEQNRLLVSNNVLALAAEIKDAAYRDFARLNVLADLRRFDEALASVQGKNVDTWPVRCRGQAHGILAEIYHKKKDDTAELEQWQLASNALGAEVGVRGRAFREAGVIHLKHGDTAKAEEQFRQAISLTPAGYAWRTESLIALSSLLIQNQRAKEAVKVFEGTDFTKIENINSKGNLLEARARALLAAGKKIKAIETFDQLLQLNIPAPWKDRINTELDQMAEEL